jgi:hypothetical protein
MDQARLREGGEHSRLLQEERRVHARSAGEIATRRRRASRVQRGPHARARRGRRIRHDDVDHAEPRERDEPVATPAHDRMERTIVHAKKHAKALAGTPMPLAKIGLLRDVDAQKAVEKAAKGGRALTAFEPFGRDVQRSFFMVTARGGFELVASTEQQSCFGNAFLELLTAPRDDAERLATMSALRVICDKLLASGVVSCFALAPSDDVRMATAFVSNGFRRTGLLQSHIVVGGERKDAIIWSRKLANPADE